MISLLGQNKTDITRRLLRWFDQHRRRFPWRETFDRPDPYKILFTEIMLQRTNAKQVVPVYNEFVRKYPTLERLSRATNREIISLFAQLGLRWRAQKIIKLVSTLRDTYDGLVPAGAAELRELPGVGEYVASAVECYAFGKRVVPIDTNVVRVMARLFGLSLKPDSGRRSKLMKDLVMEIAPARRIRDFNLGLLDLAATICKPQPICNVCPLTSNCAYFRLVMSDRTIGITN